jgi:hypothetical protein
VCLLLACLAVVTGLIFAVARQPIITRSSAHSKD